MCWLQLVAVQWSDCMRALNWHVLACTRSIVFIIFDPTVSSVDALKIWCTCLQQMPCIQFWWLYMQAQRCCYRLACAGSPNAVYSFSFIFLHFLAFSLSILIHSPVGFLSLPPQNIPLMFRRLNDYQIFPIYLQI